MMTTKEWHRRGRTRWLVIGVAVAALAGPAPAASAARDAQPAWRSCAGQGLPAGMRCAEITVPVDWAEPDGKKIELDLARLSAS